MSDTPRTDAYECTIQQASACNARSQTEWMLLVPADFARRLERELSAAIRERDAGNKALARVKELIQADEDFDADEVIQLIDARVGRYSQSLEWFAPKALTEELATALARVAELENDKARLDWLEKDAAAIPEGFRVWQDVGQTEGLRAAIDSAMGKEQSEGDAWFADQQSASVRATSNPDDPNCYRE